MTVGGCDHVAIGTSDAGCPPSDSPGAWLRAGGSREGCGVGGRRLERTPWDVPRNPVRRVGVTGPAGRDFGGL